MHLFFRKIVFKSEQPAMHL